MNKLKTAAIALGVFAGLSGASHGPGEMLQGNVAPKGIVFSAWSQLTFLGGEPAMTFLPSLLAAGILTIIVGITVAVWAGKFARGRLGGPLLILLSVLMLLVGGGIVPPLFGIAGGLILIVDTYRITKNEGANY
jgi:hypothetical protein